MDDFRFCGCHVSATHGSPAGGRRRQVVVNGRRVRTVDLHAHCIIRKALELSGTKPPMSPLYIDAHQRIREMDAASERVSVDGNREYNAGWHTALDLHNLLTVSQIVTRAALERKESRGAHFRDDYPNKDEQAGKFNIVARKGPNGEVQLTRETIPPLRDDLRQIVEEMK